MWDSIVIITLIVCITVYKCVAAWAERGTIMGHIDTDDIEAGLPDVKEPNPKKGVK